MPEQLDWRVTGRPEPRHSSGSARDERRYLALAGVMVELRHAEPFPNAVGNVCVGPRRRWLPVWSLPC